MTLIDKYTILLTWTFEKEFEEILIYIKYKLKEPKIAKKIYKKVISEINSLQFMPERYKRVQIKSDKAQNIRKMIINNYVIIYEVDNNYGQVFILHIFHTFQNYTNIL